jgi:hypothetical protein
LVAGLTFTLENERVTCVRCSVVRLLGTLPVVAAPLDVPLACPDWVAEVPLWPGVDWALEPVLDPVPGAAGRCWVALPALEPELPLVPAPLPLTAPPLELPPDMPPAPPPIVPEEEPPAAPLEPLMPAPPVAPGAPEPLV